MRDIPSTKRRSLRWAARLLPAAIIALALAALLPGAGQGAGTYNVNDRVSKLQIMYDGPCGTVNAPLSLGTPISADTRTPLPSYITVFGDMKNCFATAGSPKPLLIDSELFGYSSIIAKTTLPIPSNTWTGELTLENVSGFPELFPDSGTAYVGTELVGFNLTGNGIQITSRGAGATAHPVGSPVRVNGRLKLVSRAQERWAGGGPEADTLPADHSGSNVRSPITYLTCRARFWQPDKTAVSSRSRCYATLEPGYDPNGSPFWPDDPPSNAYPGPVLPLFNIVYHDLSSGTINQSNGELGLTTSLFGFDCLEYIPDLLWLRTSSTTNVNTTPYDTETGDFTIEVHLQPDCNDAALDPPLGDDLPEDTTLVSQEILNSTDSDGDGCTDYEELGDNQEKGGKRDPFNAYDFYDTNGDKAISLLDDIFEVAFAFGDDANDTGPGEPDGYDPNLDRANGPPLGPGSWNLGPPDPVNGVITLLDDVFNVAFQFGHTCTAAP